MNRILNPQMNIRDRLFTLITFVLGSLVVNQIQTQPGLQPREIIMTHLRSGSMERAVTNLLRLTLWATKETWLVLLHALNHLSDCQTKTFAPPFMQKSNWHATALIKAGASRFRWSNLHSGFTNRDYPCSTARISTQTTTPQPKEHLTYKKKVFPTIRN